MPPGAGTGTPGVPPRRRRTAAASCSSRRRGPAGPALSPDAPVRSLICEGFKPRLAHTLPGSRFASRFLRRGALLRPAALARRPSRGHILLVRGRRMRQDLLHARRDMPEEYLLGSPVASSSSSASSASSADVFRRANQLRLEYKTQLRRSRFRSL